MAAHQLTWALALCGVVLLLWQPAVASTAECKMISSCFFDCGHTVLDLSALRTNGSEPLFKNQVDLKGKNLFSYSPCSEFTEGFGCFNTSVCQVADIFNRNNTINVGDTQSITFTPADKGGRRSKKSNVNYLTYFHQTPDGVRRTTKVNLMCISDMNATHDVPRLWVKGETQDGSEVYEMSLTSQSVCMQVKSSTTPVTTEHTTVHHKNHTTEPHNVTTEHTTVHHKNVTSEHHNATTEHTTVHHKNVTTEPKNHTIVTMTTEHSSVKTSITTAVTSEQSTKGQITTTPSDAYSFRSSGLTVTMMTMVMTTASTVMTRL